MTKIESLLSEYGESHQNSTNKTIHWICVPLIFFSIIGLLYSVPLPLQIAENMPLNLALVMLLLVTVYYFSLSRTLWVGMLLFSVASLAVCYQVEKLAWPLWQICTAIFVLAWAGQFYGHHLEGKKPSFLKDLQFLLVGPAWIMSFIYKKLHISL